MQIVAGVDLGGTAVNYTFSQRGRKVPHRGPVRASGPLQAGARRLPASRSKTASTIAVGKAGIRSPTSSPSASTRPVRPAAPACSSASGSTNFVHADWAGYDIRENLADRLGKPVTYLNDGNAGALWGHFTLFGGDSRRDLALGHYRHRPWRRRDRRWQRGEGPQGLRRRTRPRAASPTRASWPSRASSPNATAAAPAAWNRSARSPRSSGRFLPYFLARYPGHDLGKLGDLHKAAKLVRGLAEKGDPMCVDIFRVQAHALGLFFDEMVNTFDPDALIVGGGAIETGEDSSTGSSTKSAPACPPSAKSRRTFRST